MRVNIKFEDIQWDCPIEVACTMELPTEVTLEVEVDEDFDVNLEGADVLSDKYGWCVQSFNGTILN